MIHIMFTMQWDGERPCSVMHYVQSDDAAWMALSRNSWFTAVRPLGGSAGPEAAGQPQAASHPVTGTPAPRLLS